MPTALCEQVAKAVQGVFEVAKTYEARSLEINPLVTTTDGRVIAADCRMTIDDYAVFRHPELGIEIARELDHPPAPLERIAYQIEQADHRGTFYFAQLNTTATPGSKGLVGFHGAGGGGSMMSMDAIMAEGYSIANFTDTSGNPSAAKVYRAARIILSQPGIVGYFGSGSGVASQEQVLVGLRPGQGVQTNCNCRSPPSSASGATARTVRLRSCKTPAKTCPARWKAIARTIRHA